MTTQLTMPAVDEIQSMVANRIHSGTTYMEPIYDLFVPRGYAREDIEFIVNEALKELQKVYGVQ